MGTYKETKRLSMKYYSDLFPKEKYYLEHLFFVLGNGYEWEGGELVDRQERTEQDFIEERKRFKEWEKTLLKVPKVSKAEMRKFIKSLTPGKPKKRRIYPLCQYSAIVNFPRNIKSDWLVAAEKALEWSKNLKKTKKDIRYLKKARERVIALRRIS